MFVAVACPYLNINGLIQLSASLKNSEATRFRCTRSSHIRGLKVKKVKLPFRISKVMAQKKRWDMKRSETPAKWPQPTDLIMFGSTLAAHSNVGSGEITYKTWVHMPPKMAGRYP